MKGLKVVFIMHCFFFYCFGVIGWLNLFFKEELAWFIAQLNFFGKQDQSPFQADTFYFIVVITCGLTQILNYAIFKRIYSDKVIWIISSIILYWAIFNFSVSFVYERLNEKLPIWIV